MGPRPDIEEMVRRALAYPYDPPAGSFVQIGDRTLAVPPEEIDVEGRRALLAYGANASPEALARKLAHLPPRPIPVLRVALRGWDVVYSAHVTRYGAVPAAVVASPGTVASVHLVFPDDEQLAALAATEGQNYRLEQLLDFAAELEIGGEGPREIDAFVSVHGPLLLDGSPIALAAIPARDRVFAELTTPQMIDRVRTALHPDLTLTEFVLRHVTRGGFSPLPELHGRRAENSTMS
ncbi:MAG TPA: hypothetical protein VHV53_00305 [Solirubrobacterales bacterium]|nr:hypothetical protein [Solirubrobacterales bacterium]